MTETPHDSDGRWLAAVKSTLDQDVAALDPRVAGRLQAARREALARGGTPVPRFAWAGGLVVASIALLAATLWLWQPSGEFPPPHLEEIELLASAEDLELYEDLEFYGWLADADSTN